MYSFWNSGKHLNSYVKPHFPIVCINNYYHAIQAILGNSGSYFDTDILERINNFNYLGTLITDHNDMKEKINARIHEANNVLSDILKSKLISKKAKLHIRIKF